MKVREHSLAQKWHVVLSSFFVSYLSSIEASKPMKGQLPRLFPTRSVSSEAPVASAPTHWGRTKTPACGQVASS